MCLDLAGRGFGSVGGGCTGWQTPRQDTVEGLIDELPAAWSLRLLPHSFLTPVALGGWAQGLPIWEPGTVMAWWAVFLGYSGRAEVWSQSPRSPETQGPAQVDCQRANGHAQNSLLWSSAPFKKEELVGVAIASISHTKNTDSKARRIHTCPDSRERSQLSPVQQKVEQPGMGADCLVEDGCPVQARRPSPRRGRRRSPLCSLLTGFIVVQLHHHGNKGPASSRPVLCVTTAKTGRLRTHSHPPPDLLTG